MKKIKQFLLIVFFILTAVNSIQAQDEKTDQFIKQAFGALQTKDSVKFKALFPDYKTFIEIMNKMMEAKDKTAADSSDKKTNFADLFTKEVYENEVSAKETKRFRRIVSSAERAGVVWNTSKFDSYTIENSEDLPGAVQEMNGAIFFFSGAVKFKMPFKNTVRYNNSLYGISFRKTYKLVGDKYLDEDGNEEIK